MRSLQVARKSTCQKELRKHHNTQKAQQGIPEVLNKVSKVKPQKLVTTVKKRMRKDLVVQSDVAYSLDVIPLNNRLAAGKRKVSTKRSTIGDVQQPSSTRSSSPNLVGSNERKTIKTYSNKKKATNNEMCKELFEKCDERTLFKMMVEKFDAEQILQGYKEKRNAWGKKEIIQEAAKVLNVNLDNPTIANKDAKLESLHKVLKELSNLVELKDEIADMVIKMYGHRLKPEKVFELLDRNKIKEALLKKFTANEFLDLFRKTNNSAVIQQILEMASVDAIVKEVKARKDPETLQALLKVLVDMYTEIIPAEEMNKSQSVPLEASSNATGLTGAIIDVINSKKILKTSEDLLNFMLQNVDDVVSKETKNNLVNFFMKKYSTEELMDISHDAAKISLIKNKKISLIDISD